MLRSGADVWLTDGRGTLQETENACTGLMYFRPPVRAQQLLHDWHNMCIELNQNNQGAFNRVFSGTGAQRHMDYYIMPKQLYPHGALIELVSRHISPLRTLLNNRERVP